MPVLSSNKIHQCSFLTKILFYTSVYSRNNLSDLFCIKYATSLYSEVHAVSVCCCIIIGSGGYTILEYIFEPLFFIIILFFWIKCISHLTFILHMLHTCSSTNLKKRKKKKRKMNAIFYFFNRVKHSLVTVWHPVLRDSPKCIF